MAATGQVATKIGKIWRTQEGKTPESRLFEMTGTGTVPVAGDLTHVDAAGNIEALLTTAGSATLAARTIAGVLVQEGNEQNAIYNPGIQAATFSTVKTLNIGGRGSHTKTRGPIVQRFMVPMHAGLSWVMNRYDDAAITVGNSYGVRRTAAGVYFLDPTITDDVVTVVGYYEPDTDGFWGDALKAIPRVWVKPFASAEL